MASRPFAAKGLKFGLYTAVGNFTCASGRFAIDPIGLGCDYAKIPECEVAKRDIDDFVSAHRTVLAASFAARGAHAPCRAAMESR